MRNLLRHIISRLANFTPNVIYFADGWPMKINDLAVKIEAERGGRNAPIVTAAISVACAAHEYLKLGDVATMKLTSVTRGENEIGHFIVIVKRVTEEQMEGR